MNNLNPWQEAVKDFHEVMDMPAPSDVVIGDVELRAKLIAEEAAETIAALGYNTRIDIRERTGRRVALFAKDANQNFVEVIDGLVDLIYVTVGAAVTWGIDLEPFFAEVHRSNMDKAGGPKRGDGKQLKPEGWQPPDIAGVLARQMFPDDFGVEAVIASPAPVIDLPPTDDWRQDELPGSY